MSLQRRRATAWAVALAVALGFSSMAGAAAASAASGSSDSGTAITAKAKKQKKHHKKAHHKKKHHKKKHHKKKHHKLKGSNATPSHSGNPGFPALPTAPKATGTTPPTETPKKPAETPQQPAPQAIGVGPMEKGGTKAIEDASEIPLAPAFTEEQLNAEPSGNYLSSMGGTTGDHFSRLTEINTSNVSQLHSTWMTQLEGAGLGDSNVRHGGEMAPVEYEGVLYYSTGTDDIFAVSVASGKILWVAPGELPDNFGYILNGGGNRGLAIGDGMIFSSVLSGDVEALNQKTGKVEWRSQIGSPTEGISVTSGPLYYNGMVIIGPVGGEEGVRGFVEAFDAETGELLWKHYNIPGPGEFGHNTWPVNTPCRECNNEWSRGGAVVWFAPTVDDKTGLLYYGTSNAAEDYFGENRNGANLWNCSVVAINAKTGNFAWGFQEVHHDVWDDDQGNQPDMVRLNVNGEEIEAVAAVNKDGLVYVLNAVTGEPVPIDKVEEKSLATSLNSSYPTQPIPSMPAMHPYAKATEAQLAELQTKENASTAAYNAKEEARVAEEEKEIAEGKKTGPPKSFTPVAPATVIPGGAEEKGILTAVRAVAEPGNTVVETYESGGVQYAVSSFNPETATYIVDGSGGGSISANLEELAAQPFVRGEKWNGVHSNKITASAGVSAGGWLTAYNLDTGQEIWALEGGGGVTNNALEGASANAGTTQTAGGLTFLGNGKGVLKAINSANGQELWSWSLGSNTAASSAVYEWNGKEYVTIYTSEHGDNLWTFALNGTGPEPIALGATPPPGTTLPEYPAEGKLPEPITKAK